jgi:hypothetical protein
VKLRRASLFLVGIIAVQFGFAAMDEAQHWLYFPDGDIPTWQQLLGHCYWVAVVGLLYLWCREDAKDRVVTPPFAISILVPVLFPIGVPYYYWPTYPSRSAFLHVGLAVLFLAACAAAFWLGRRLVFDYYAIWTNHPHTR